MKSIHEPKNIVRNLICAAALAASLPSPAQTVTPGANPADTALEAANGKPVQNDGIVWELVLSPYTHHWSQDPAHKRVGLVGLERHDLSDHSFWGLALFPNSFGQNSAYGYYGHEWNSFLGHEPLYVKVSAGIIYGYTGEYKNKVPFNYKGFAPVVIPALGYRLTPKDSAQIAVLGNAGVMFMYDRRF